MKKIWIAATYCACFTALGLCIASLGPVLLQLSAQTGTTLREVSYAFTARSVGYLFGSFSGPLFDRYPGGRLLSASLFACGLGTFLVPFISDVGLLTFFVSLQGTAMGFLDTGANVLLIWLFGSEVGPYMQAMHFSFAMGGFLGPLFIRASMVATEVEASEGVDAYDGDYRHAFFGIGVYCWVLAAWLFFTPSSHGHGPKGVRTHDPPASADAAGTAGSPATTAVNASLTGTAAHASATSDWFEDVHSPTGETPNPVATEENGAAAASDTALSSLDPATAASPATTSAPESDAVASSAAALAPAAVLVDAAEPEAPQSRDGGLDVAPPLPWWKSCADKFGCLLPPPSQPIARRKAEMEWGVVVGVAILLGLYVGNETGYGGFITAYTVLQLNESEATGQMLSAGYWVAIAVGRFSSVWISLRYNAEQMLWVTLVGCVLSSVCLAIFPPSLALLWPCTIWFGLSMACVFPTTVNLAEMYIPVQGRHATWFVVGASVGEMIVPLLIGWAMGNSVSAEDGDQVSEEDRSQSNPHSLMIITVVVAILTFLSFVVLRKWGRRTRIYRDEHREDETSSAKKGATETRTG